MPANPGPSVSAKVKAGDFDTKWDWPRAAAAGPVFPMPDLDSALTLRGTVLALQPTASAAPDDLRECEFAFTISVKRASDGSIVGADDTPLPIAIPNTKNDGVFVPTLALTLNGAGVSLDMTGMTAVAGNPKVVYSIHYAYAPFA